MFHPKYNFLISLKGVNDGHRVNCDIKIMGWPKLPQAGVTLATWK